MYTKYFGLSEKPFSITPDPHFLYLSERHTEALAHLVYGVTESGGFIQLTGEVGTGKTTLTRCLLDRLPASVDLAVVLNPRLTVQEFLFTIFDELHVEPPHQNASTKELVDALNAHLLKSHTQGRRTVLLVDEAQSLDSDVLEQLRLLTNLETSKEKLLQIILVGQPELRTTLARNDLRQLAQRITGRYHLENLTAQETIAYVNHRMKVAGNTDGVFESAALWEVHRLTEGSPRLINVICDRALLGAYSAETKTVTKKIVAEAAAEIHGLRPSNKTNLNNRSNSSHWKILASTLALISALAGGWGIAQFFNDQEQRQATMSSDTLDERSNERSSEGVSQHSAQTTASLPGAEEVTLREAAVTKLNLSRSLSLSDNARRSATDISAATVTQAKVGDLLNDSTINTSTDRAFEELFALWSRPTDFGEVAPCRWAAQHNLKCEFLVGSVRVINTINRPAVLSLVDDSGQSHNAVVSGIDERFLTLLVDGNQYQIEQSDLARYWFGEFLVLWQPQDGVDRLLVPNTRSDEVAWLRNAIAQINGQPTPVPNSTYFDQTLANDVVKFQRANRLEADAKVGIQTLIAINSAMGIAGTPVLNRSNSRN